MTKGRRNLKALTAETQTYIVFGYVLDKPVTMRRIKILVKKTKIEPGEK